MSQRILFFLIALFTSAIAFGKTDNILRVRTFGEPATLDWNRASTPVEATLVRNLQEGLVAISPKLQVIPAIAESWKISSDGKTYTFHLRKDVQWSDGKKLTASEFVDSWERLLNADTKANTAYLLFDVVGAEDYNQGREKDFSKVGVHALNAHTLQVQLRAPVPYWIWIPTFWTTFPIRKDLIAKYGANWDKPGKLVTVGPYTLTSHEPNHLITLARNAKYYGKCGNVDQIHAYLISDDRAAVEKFQAGELDFVTRISAADVQKLKLDKDLKRWPELRTAHLDLNPNLAPTDNVAFRRILLRAIDRQQISKLVAGAYEPATSFIPPGLLAYDKNAGLKFESGLAHKKQNAALEMVAPAFDDFMRVGDFLKAEFKKNLGIDVKVSTFEPKRFYSSAVNFGGYHMILTHWTADYPDPDNFFSIFLSNVGNNRVSWKNAQYDALILKARTLNKNSMRAPLYAKAQKLLLQDQAITLPLYYGTNHALVRKDITGFQPTPTNSFLFKDFSLVTSGTPTGAAAPTARPNP